MSREKDHKWTLLCAASISLLATSLIALLLVYHYDRIQFQLTGYLCQKIIEEYPDSTPTILKILKTAQDHFTIRKDENILLSFGYQPGDFGHIDIHIFGIIAAGFLAGSALSLFGSVYLHKKTAARIKTLTDYLEKVNTGGQGLLLDTSKDAFSGLQDEIYKTITMLYQTRDAALKAKNNFADNLSNIAHQLKTPITALSLSAQMIQEDTVADHREQIQRQLKRLTYLEEALLLLARIDSGTLTMHPVPVDVFTLLTLASDALQEMCAQKGISIYIPEAGEIMIAADLDWTMEAILNLMKDCMEHSSPGMTVHCSYEENPLYTQIQIWDEGRGFAKEDLPHVFERFYRGKDSAADGIGIGLSLSKAIIELQSGIIRASNLPNHGACFEIRFYRH